MTGGGEQRSDGEQRGDNGKADAGKAREGQPPVDGPGAAEDNDEPGATSYDEPGGQEHGT